MYGSCHVSASVHCSHWISVSQETRYCRCAKHAFLEIILFPITHLHPLCTLQEETSANWAQHRGFMWLFSLFRLTPRRWKAISKWKENMILKPLFQRMPSTLAYTPIIWMLCWINVNRFNWSPGYVYKWYPLSNFSSKGTYFRQITVGKLIIIYFNTE